MVSSDSPSTNSLTVREFREITPESVQIFDELEQSIFKKPISSQSVESLLRKKPGILMLYAVTEIGPVGYKVGFEQEPRIFYSWVGGVLPTFRRRGIASLLLVEQHKRLRELGYRFVRTATKNRYREMLLLNIKNGFNVTGVQHKLDEIEQSILLEKDLLSEG